jgi:DNA (cytosine-5)-methyltransferase 1
VSVKWVKGSGGPAGDEHYNMVVQPIAMRESGQGYWLEDTVSGTIDASMGQSGHANRVATIAVPVTATGPVTHTLKAEGLDGSEDGTGRGTPIVPHEVTGTLSSRATAAGGLGTDFEVAGGLQAVDVYNGTITGQVTATLNASTGASANHSGPQVLAPTLTASNDPSRSPQSSEITQQVAAVLAALPTMAVRRLLPVECERLQGFPDDHTNIPWRGKPAPDGPRYKSMGNSMAVPVMRWIGERLDRVAKGLL